MKKKTSFIIVTILVIAAAIAVFWYELTYGKNTVEPSAYVENVISDNTSYMENIVDSLNGVAAEDSSNLVYNLMYYEAQIELAGEVDTLNEYSVRNVTTVFQTAATDTIKGGTKTTVYIISNDTIGQRDIRVVEDQFWFGDEDMYKITPKISCYTAYNIVWRANCVKPNSRFVTLRRSVHSSFNNPQYIFGNDTRGLLYVDALTGELATRDSIFGMTDSLQAFPVARLDSVK